MSGGPWVLSPARGPARPLPPALRRSAGPSTAEASATARRVALADFRVACGQAALGAGVAAIGLVSTAGLLQSAQSVEEWAGWAFFLLLLVCFVLPLAVASSISMRHYHIGDRSGAGTLSQAAAPLVPSAFFVGGLYVIAGVDGYLAFLLVPGAPSAGLLALALVYSRGPDAWPLRSLAVGAGGLAIAIGACVAWAAWPTWFVGAAGAAGQGAGLGGVLVAPLLAAALAQCALGLYGRFMPVRLRTEGAREEG